MWAGGQVWVGRDGKPCRECNCTVLVVSLFDLDVSVGSRGTRAMPLVCKQASLAHISEILDLAFLLVPVQHCTMCCETHAGMEIERTGLGMHLWSVDRCHLPAAGCKA